MKRDLILYALITLLTLGMSSCGARKTQKSETKEEVKKDSVAKTKEIVVSESELNKEVAVYEDNFTIEPIDINKVVEITDASGKVTRYKNARIKREKKISSEKTAYLDKTVKISEKEVKKSVISKTEHTEKSTERESVFAWWWLIVPLIIIIAVYLFWRKYKDVVIEAEEII